MADPVPNNIRSLEQAILKEWEALSEPLVEIFADRPLDQVSSIASYEGEFGNKVWKKPDGTVVSREYVIKSCEDDGAWQVIKGHLALETSTDVARIFDDSTKNDVEKARVLKLYFEGIKPDPNRFDVYKDFVVKFMRL